MAIDSDLIRGHVDTIILKTLASGDKYGYEIIKEIETRSNGTYELKQPTLYSCLKRLESQGFISAYWVNSDIGGKRHYYKLTELGRAEYDNNMREWLSSRSIIDNLIAENADEVLPEVTTNFVPLTGTENITFRKKTNEDDNTNTEQDHSLMQSGGTDGNGIIEKIPPIETTQTMMSDIEQSKNQTPTENTSSYDMETNTSNPFAEFSDINENNDGLSETDEQDLKLIEEYYNTDENQFDIFSAVQNQTGETYNQFETSNSSDDSINLLESRTGENDDKENQNNDETEKLEETDSIEGVVIRREESTSSTKFNFKDYKLNNDNYFSQVKEEKGGSGTCDNYADDYTHEEQTPDTSMFDEMINSQDSYDSALTDTFYNNEDENVDENEEFHIERRYSDIEDYSLTGDSENDENSFDDEDEEYSDSKLNFGFNEDNEETSSPLIFGSEEYNNSYNQDNDYSNNINDFEEIEDLQKTSYFSSTNEDNIDEFESYEKFSNENNNIEVSVNEECESTYISKQNDPVQIEPEIEPYKEPIFPDPDATATLFADNKRSFVPQYTDNDSRQLLNTLSSYGSIKFAPATKSNKLPSTTISSIDELRTNFSNAGIDVRVYERRPKESAETKNYILTNKIKMFTSWISFALVSFLLVIGYLIAGPIGYTNLTYVPTSHPASFYLILTLGIVLVIPIIFTIMFFMNQTKKVRPRYSAKIAIIFSLLFTVQLLVIIYAINIPFGLYSFTQIDYNHLLWYLPAICAFYIPIHTAVYTLLFNSKKFHV